MASEMPFPPSGREASMLRASYVIVALLLTACATSTQPTTRISAASRNVITAAEIVASHVSDVYQAVVQLRPDYLRRRAATLAPNYRQSGVVVYLDELKYGDVESLQ